MRARRVKFAVRDFTMRRGEYRYRGECHRFHVSWPSTLWKTIDNTLVTLLPRTVARARIVHGHSARTSSVAHRGGK